MAQTYDVYFFLKIVKKADRKGTKGPPVIMWELTSGGKTVKVDISKSLASAGSMAQDVNIDVYLITKAVDEAGARAMLKDPTFEWKDDALVITLHKIQVSVA